MPNKKARNKNTELTYAPLYISLTERSTDDSSFSFDLPPSSLAKTANLSTTKTRKRKSRPAGKSWEAEDDTPKAFARLMDRQSGSIQPRKGLDNGDRGKKKKKRKLDDSSAMRNVGKKFAKEELKIKPGESMGEFSRRVDAAIPVHFPKGDGASRGKQVISRKKKEGKRNQKEDGDDNVEPEEGEEIHSDDAEVDEGLRAAMEEIDKVKRRAKGRKRGESPDPWAELTAKREAPKFGEVVAAPPSLKKPRPLLKTRGAAVDVDGVPRAAGSLAKREELAGERRSIVEAYRKLMEGKRSGKIL